MGQPSAPTIYQQPSPQEVAASKASDDQKRAALVKLNQAVHGESQGLRGMGGLYDWAGPTPFLAASMNAGNMWRKSAADNNAGGAGFGQNPFGTGWEGGGMPGTAGGAPRNTGAVPGGGFAIADTSQGAPRNTGAVPTRPVSPVIPASVYPALGLPTPATLPPAPTGQGAPRNTGAVPTTPITYPANYAATVAQKAGLPVTPTTPPPAVNPATVASYPLRAAAAAGLPVQAPAAPAAPTPVAAPKPPVAPITTPKQQMPVYQLPLQQRPSIYMPVGRGGRL